MKKLVFNTTKSLYKPIEIVIDGKTYTSKKLTKSVLDKVFSFDEKVRNGDTNAPYEQASFTFDIPLNVLYKLDATEVGVINRSVLSNLYDPEKAEEDPEKNVKGPGEKGSDK